MAEPGEDYWLINYGECELGPKCVCLKTGWFDIICSHWNPLGARSVEDLMIRIRKHKYNDLDSTCDGPKQDKQEENKEVQGNEEGS